MRYSHSLWAGLALAAAVPLAVAQSYRDREFNALELAKLPEYCYAQYVNKKLESDARYSIQRCGPYMNHFCPGLIDLMRAQDVRKPTQLRRERVASAVKNFEYTLSYMPEGCWLREDADAAMRMAVELEPQIR